MIDDQKLIECNDNMTKYNRLDDKVENVLEYIIMAENATIDLQNKMANLYQVNDLEPAIKLRLKALTDDIDNTRKNLNDIIMPSLNQKNSDLNNEWIELNNS